MIRTRILMSIAATAAVTLSLAACGGDDSSSSDRPAATARDDSGTADTANDGTDDTTADTTADDGSDDDGSNGADLDGGSCQVDVTGDAETSFSAPGGIMAANTQYWLTDAQKDFFGEGFYFILNCDSQDNDDYLGILAGAAATEDSVPFAPKTYTLSPAESIFGGGGEDSPLSVLLTVDGDDAVWGVSEPGTIDITAFDDDHIAGTVSFTAMNTLAKMSGEPDRTIQVTATFDFDNPN